MIKDESRIPLPADSALLRSYIFLEKSISAMDIQAAKYVLGVNSPNITSAHEPRGVFMVDLID